MPFFIRNNRYILYALVLGLFLINVIVNSALLEYITGLIAIPVFLISFLGATRLFRILGTAFMGTGAVLFIVSGLSWSVVPVFMTSNMQLLAFLAVLPWMNSVVRAGRFDRRINQLLRANVEDLGKLYVRSLFTTYILVSFINLSALPLSQHVLLENLSKMKKKVKESFISRTTLRAFTVALAWSPMEIMVAITIDATGVGYISYLPWLLLCSVLVLLLDAWRGSRIFHAYPYEPAGGGLNRTIRIKPLVYQIVQLFLALAVFLVIVVVLGNWSGLNFILTVTLVIIPFSFLWALVIGRWKSFRVVGWRMWKIRTNGMQNFVVLFLSLGFFSSSLNETPFLEMIRSPFLAASDFPIVILLLIQFTYLAMSMVGVHPIATVGVLIEVLPPLFEVINPMSIGIVLITGALATGAVGTYGITVTMTAQNTSQNPYKITVRNMPFAVFYGGVGTFVGFLLL
ncbi:hypothetical protein D7Z54_19685 [Salibacterium salarium]|uniref:Uncharacterized protein n=1 Tax=Salibacterium salarium TaxID=284579 RepID=A0A3R9P2W1_9BACI|nr:hypothetical protein [Salibacterium salarium]RSL31665.1 hypothetical protein D7Z54_19685 [Salibacterium salarium]